VPETLRDQTPRTRPSPRGDIAIGRKPGRGSPPSIPPHRFTIGYFAHGPTHAAVQGGTFAALDGRREV
jgi:hypothetical protein